MYIRTCLHLMLLLTANCLSIHNKLDVERYTEFPGDSYPELHDIDLISKDPSYFGEVIPNDVQDEQYNDDINEGTLEDILFEGAKRGIENVKSPTEIEKRWALEQLNELWKNEKIREMYNNLRSEKRSKEYIEHIPVQAENQQDDTWMIDEIGYYTDPFDLENDEALDGLDADNEEVDKIDFPSFVRGLKSETVLVPSYTDAEQFGWEPTEKIESKRGWERIHPFIPRNSWTRKQPIRIQGGKRAWEPIRTLNGKRAWEPIRTLIGKRAWEPIRTLIGKRAWEPIITLNGKRKWKLIRMLNGKRSGEPTRTLNEKRAWEPIRRSQADGKRVSDPTEKLVEKRGWEPILFVTGNNERSKRTLEDVIRIANELTQQTQGKSDLQQSLLNVNALRNKRYSEGAATRNVNYDTVENSQSKVTL